jgi:hypothetical protein
MKQNLRQVFSYLILSLCLTATSYAGSRSAVITLGLPIGARQLAMGESGVALPEDVFSAWWNPAGIAFSPLSNEWLTQLEHNCSNCNEDLTGIRREGFLSHSEIWTSKAGKLLLYKNGEWKSDFNIVLRGQLKFHGAVRRFIGTDQNLDQITQKIREYNGWTKDTPAELMLSFNIPWDIVLNDSVTSLLWQEDANQLWVGTSKGLYRFDGNGFKNFNSDLQGHVTSLAAQKNTIWVGTQNGLYRTFRSGLIRRGTPLPGQNISSLAFDKKNVELYVGMKSAGIARLIPAGKKSKKDSWTLYDTEDGLPDNSPISMSVSKTGNLWVAHKNAIARFSRSRWTQVAFEGVQVQDIKTDENGAIWIATSGGLWKHSPEIVQANLTTVENTDDNAEVLGEWVHYHTGNGLKGNSIFRVLPVNGEIWVRSDHGVEQFKVAKRQVGIFYENLLPKLGIPDLYHMATAMSWPINDWGTIGFFFNFVSFGESTIPNDDENSTSDNIKVNSSEIVVGFSYGVRVTPNFSLGTNIKGFYSDLLSGVPSEPDATTGSYAVDAGLLWKIWNEKLNFGASLLNMGPAVSYTSNSEVDPIPLTWRAGFAYNVFNLHSHRLVLTADMNKETLTFDKEGEPDAFYVSAFKGWTNESLNTTFEQIMYNTGIEYTWSNMFSLRFGYLDDAPGQRTEFDFGLGFLMSELLQADVAIIKDLSGNEVRDLQTRFSLAFLF